MNWQKKNIFRFALRLLYFIIFRLQTVAPGEANIKKNCLVITYNKIKEIVETNKIIDGQTRKNNETRLIQSKRCVIKLTAENTTNKDIKVEEEKIKLKSADEKRRQTIQVKINIQMSQRKLDMAIHWTHS